MFYNTVDAPLETVLVINQTRQVKKMEACMRLYTTNI